jgi:hypothetical protein
MKWSQILHFSLLWVPLGLTYFLNCRCQLNLPFKKMSSHFRPILKYPCLLKLDQQVIKKPHTPLAKVQKKPLRHIEG